MKKLILAMLVVALVTPAAALEKRSVEEIIFDTYRSATLKSNDVVLEIQSTDGSRTLQLTVGMRIVDEGGTLWESYPDGDYDVKKFYETLYHYGLNHNHPTSVHFSGRDFRKELLSALKRLLWKGVIDEE